MSRPEYIVGEDGPELFIPKRAGVIRGTPLPLRRPRPSVWPWLLVLVLTLAAMLGTALHRDNLRELCVARGGVPSDAMGWDVRCTEPQP